MLTDHTQEGQCPDGTCCRSDQPDMDDQLRGKEQEENEAIRPRYLVKDHDGSGKTVLLSCV